MSRGTHLDRGCVSGGGGVGIGGGGQVLTWWGVTPRVVLMGE